MIVNERLDGLQREVRMNVSPAVERTRIIRIREQVGTCRGQLFADVRLDILIAVFVGFRDPLADGVIRLEQDSISSDPL